MDMTLAEAPTRPDVPLEIVEMDLALRHQDLVDKGFEGAVHEALEHVGGRILFKMRLCGHADCDWVAAVELQSEGDDTLAIISQSTEGGPLKVEDARTSELPVAAIATGFASLERFFPVPLPADETEPAPASDA